jgi:ribonuclease R
MKENILNCMKTKAYRPMRLHELSEAMEIKPGQKKGFRELLMEMEKEGLVMVTRSETVWYSGKNGIYDRNSERSLERIWFR